MWAVNDWGKNILMAEWTRFTVRHKWIVIIFWSLLVIATIPLAMQVTRHLTANGFDRPGSRAQWATNQLVRLNPVKSPDPLLISGLPLSGVDMAARSARIPLSSLHAVSPQHILYLPPATATVATSHTFQNQLASRHAQWQDATQGAVGNTVSQDSSKTLAMSGLLAVPFLAILLFAVFGSVAAISLPLLIAVVGSEFALSVITLIETHIQLSVFLTDIVTFLALGVGIDYALFISTRFRQEMDRGLPADEAVLEAMRHAGRSVLYSGVAVALAVATLLLGGNAYWQGLALGGAVAIVSVLFATHSLLPAVMSVMGSGVRWGGMKRVPDFGFWRVVGRFVSEQPWVAASAAVILLLPLAFYGPGIVMRTPANLATMLPVKSPIRLAVNEQQKIQGPGSIAPLGVALKLPGTLSQAKTWQAVSVVTAHLKSMKDAKAVASPVSLGIGDQGLAAMISHPATEPAAVKDALRNFINPGPAPHLVVIYVTARTGPDSAATAALSEQIDQGLSHWLPAGSRAAVGGQVPILQSFNNLTSSRLPIIIASALVVALVVLSVATGSLLQALLGVIFDALVALATAGLLVVVTQNGLLGFQPQPLDSSITPLIFVLLFGLSMDYEVILLHRIQEPLRQGASVKDAVYHGVSSTGAMITGAGMIMVIVFLSLMISPLQVMKTLSLGLSFAVLVDTWLVRSLLVPSMTVLLGKNAYWPWRPRVLESGEITTTGGPQTREEPHRPVTDSD